MKRHRLSRAEKRMLLVGGGVPVLFAGLGGLYEWNNRVPVINIPLSTLPNPNAFNFYQQAAQNYNEPITNPGVDIHVDSWNQKPIQIFSPAYNRRYPLARKQIFLRQNAPILRPLRRGLVLPYLQPPERDGKDQADLSGYRRLARLLIIEAHARAQRENWDGAADSLLDVIHLGYQVPHGGPLRASVVGIAIHVMAYKEFPAILPHLSSAKASSAILQLEKWHQSDVSGAQALEEEKRAMQAIILGLIRSRDFRPVFVGYGCIGPCQVSDEQYQNDLDSLSPLLKMRLAWMNKPRLLSEYTRCMDWQIGQVSKPYPLRTKSWPFPKSYGFWPFPKSPDDAALTNWVYMQFPRAIINFSVNETRNTLLKTMLALHAYKLEKGCYPESLQKLVPRYLPQVPLDPFSNMQPLRYRPASLRYIRDIKFVLPSRTKVNGGLVSSRRVDELGQIPYTLYSIGPDARDDGGAPYESHPQEYHRTGRRYSVDLSLPDTTKADIVAGINQ